MDRKQKYVRLKDYNEIIIFPQILEHSKFRNMNPISAGFCFIDNGKIDCFGESVSLRIESMDDDSFMATKQIFGWEAAEKLL